MYLDKIVIGSRVAPTKGLRVGFGVVIGIHQYSKQNNPDKPDRRVYEVMTDFGNFIKFTQEEFCEMYTNEIYYEWDMLKEEIVERNAVDNLEERINDQILNLQLALYELQERGVV